MSDRKYQRAYKSNNKAIYILASGMTLVEMLCFMALVPCILIGVFIGSAIIGSWYGWLLGAVLGFLVFFIFGSIWNLLKVFWSGIGLPKCRNGCCRVPSVSSDDEGGYETQVIEGELYEVCKCGDRYQKKGRRFVLINENGTETPYLGFAE